MRYIFLAFILVALSAVGVLGFRGQIMEYSPIQVFNDMDQQAKVKAQKDNKFFADGRGARLPVDATVPMGYHLPDELAADGAIQQRAFSTTEKNYYTTGKIGTDYGTGMPEELGLTAENVDAFLRLGEEQYGIYCAICHSPTGDGQGMIAKRGWAAIANLHQVAFSADEYADGRVYETITNGKGLMKSYADKLTIRERWAVVAYVRALQNVNAGVSIDTPGLKSAVEADLATSAAAAE
ncbi:c-type cytochrome [Sulfuriroseicoccus oceanibius]|uniref:Cytochrome c n=1 Tax=Sulfuriroseicoccus oceanibius TaxID=2707525 RepID=A0A6B3L3S6_9BACT|nr:cytochrome c [Sulfuriroseicoccus oceanibius]QQL44637.1 cytochrome c [Sulfuriroseicoccus oceanibius]